MRKFLYAVSLVCGFWYFLSPFIIKTAATLQGRAAGELIGLLIIIFAYQGFRSNKKSYALGLIFAGVLSLVWGIVGGAIFDFGGSLHAAFFALVLFLLAWFIRHTFEGEQAQVLTSKGSIKLDGLEVYDDALHFSDGEEEQFELSLQDVIKLLSALSFKDTRRFFAGLFSAASQLRKK